MRLHENPGVYHERADADAGGVSALRTDIAGMVGIAERGPLHLAVPVESYRQFQAWFGDAIDNGYLAYCARAFFDNGGRRLWAVRVASDAAAAAWCVLDDDRGPGVAQPVWRIEASGPGVWGERLSLRLKQVRRVQTRAVPDAAAPERVRVDVIAGFASHTLVELLQAGAPPQRAVVRRVDAVQSRLELDRVPAGLAVNVPVRIETVGYSIDIYNAGRLVGVVEDLSLIPGHPRYGPAVLCQPWQVIDRTEPEREPQGASSHTAIQYFRVARNRSGTPPGALCIRELRDAPAREALHLLAVPPQPVALHDGADGLAALAERDFIGEPTSPHDSDLVIAHARRGLAALDPVEEIGVVAIPDIHIQPREPAQRLRPVPCVVDPCLPNAPLQAPVAGVVAGDLPPRFDLDAIARVQAAQVSHCERHRDRIALLDAPYDTCVQLTQADTALRAWRQRFESAFAALYAPWVRVVDPLRVRPGSSGASPLRSIPPCGHVAGLVAATDLRSGVHVAPANAPMLWAQALTLDLDDERHGLLNSLGINALRAVAGRGLRVMGARTLSSDTDWRFLNVRRLMCMIEKAIDASIQWAVFEPNDWRTRTKLTLVIGSFLQELYNRGAMVGATPEQAYYLRCDDGNNPADARARGELLIEIGIAATVPFEFIVLRIGRDANGFAIHEADPVLAAA